MYLQTSSIAHANIRELFANNDIAPICATEQLGNVVEDTLFTYALLQDATSRNQLERNLIYFRRGAYLERFSRYLTTQASSDEWDNKKKRNKRHPGSHASCEEAAFALGMTKQTSTIDKQIKYYLFICVFSKFFFAVYSKVVPGKVHEYLNSNGGVLSAESKIRDKYLDVSATDRDAFLLSNFQKA